MAKNIVICSDGTGNSAIKGRGTNVFKMFESVDLNGHRFDHKLTAQVAIYDDGVGTESFKVAKVLGGAVGYGLSRNVKQLYKELCRIYDPGDRLFLFGFSRGAFTIRTLAGFIVTLGILKVASTTRDELERKVRKAYKEYRHCYRTSLMKLFLGAPEKSATQRYREAHSHGNESIAFIGVWDTVDAVGLPLNIANVVNTTIYQFKFPNLVLSSAVERAYHALAIDDERQSFHPLLWDQSGQQRPGQEIEQVWFAGVHSNVGGGYPKQGMSLVALDWMMEKAAAAGLRFVTEDRRYYAEHASVDDKLYNPRSGIGMFYRWLPRNIREICRRSGIAPTFHVSVLERIAHGTDDYGPGNLPPNALVTFTPTNDPSKNRAAADRSEAMRRVIADGHDNDCSLLDTVGGAVSLGRWSYRMLLASVFATLLVAAAPEGAAVVSWAALKALPSTIGGLVTSPIDSVTSISKRLIAQPLALGLVSAGLLISFALAWYSDRRIAGAYSRYWFARQKTLRQALKDLRLTGGVSTTPKKDPVGA